MPQTSRCNTRSPSSEQLVNALISECRQPARLLELYYWTTQPELLAIVRRLASLPSETRERLDAFFDCIQPESVSAKLEAGGRIRLIGEEVRRPSAA